MGIEVKKEHGDGLGEAKRAVKKEAKAPASLSIRLCEALGKAGRPKGIEGAWSPFEERLAAFEAILGDGLELLKKETVQEFREGLKSAPRQMSWPDGEPKGRLGIDNALNALDCWPHGEACEIALIALMRCEAFSKAPQRVAQALFDQVKVALSYEKRSVEGMRALAREWARHPRQLEALERSGGGGAEAFAKTLGDLSIDVAYDEKPKLVKASLAAIEELVGAAQERAQWRQAKGRTEKGEALLALCRYESRYSEKSAEKLYESLCAKAVEWIKEGVDRAEEGAVALALCQSVVEAVDDGSLICAKAASSALQEALAMGEAAREPREKRARDGEVRLSLPGAAKSSAFRVLMSAGNPGGELGAELARAGQAMMDAGAGVEDLVASVEDILARARNQELARALRSRLERQEIQESLGALTQEEMEWVEALRRAKREAAEEAPAKRRSGL